jgi:hypothetical protein
MSFGKHVQQMLLDGQRPRRWRRRTGQGLQLRRQRPLAFEVSRTPGALFKVGAQAFFDRGGQVSPACQVHEVGIELMAVHA